MIIYLATSLTRRVKLPTKFGISPNRSLPLFLCRHRNGSANYLTFSLLTHFCSDAKFCVATEMGKHILCCTCPTQIFTDSSGWRYQLSSV